MALGQGMPKRAVDLPVPLASALAEVKTKSNLAVLLPSRLPRPFTPVKHAVVQSASKDEYSISLYFQLNVGYSGFAASFDANAHPGYGPKEIPNASEVQLSNGVIGYFRPVSCGGACAPANLWWEEDHVLYQIQLKLSPELSEANQQKTIVATANSAIAAGPR